MATISPLQFLKKEEIEAQALSDLTTYKKKTGKPVSFPIYPEEIAEVLWGVSVEYPENIIDNDGFEVLACYLPSQKKIQLNTSLDQNRGRTSFSLAHEVGHVSLHSFLKDFTPEGVKMFCRSLKKEIDAVHIERQADTYASCLLMPRNEMEDFLQVLGIVGDEGIFDFRIHGQEACNHFGVSKQALGIRLADMRVKMINSFQQFVTLRPVHRFITDEERMNW